MAKKKNMHAFLVTVHGNPLHKFYVIFVSEKLIRKYGEEGAARVALYGKPIFPNNISVTEIQYTDTGETKATQPLYAITNATAYVAVHP